MSRRRAVAASDQDDAMDLLLDTVSNVFGGVMFLTLLAALLVISRGGITIDEIDDSPQEPVEIQNDGWMIAEMQKTQARIAAQQMLIDQFDPTGEVDARRGELETLLESLAAARRQHRRADETLRRQKDAMQDETMADSQLETQVSELEAKVAAASREFDASQKQILRTIAFRPLRASRTIEAVVVLRYGRWYLLQNGPEVGHLNTDDFFVLPGDDGVLRVTAKPHRGHPVDPTSTKRLVEQLRREFPSGRYHVTIAVWDDSFAEFNPLKDALSGAGYQYRTLTCDSSARLSNSAAVSAYVQ